MRKAAVSFFLLLCTACLMSAQQPFTSPRGDAEHAFADGKKIAIQYGRPSMHGRKIMGGLVPYDKVWRTGANAATTLTTDVDLTIGGASVPAGKYTLYTLPGEKAWKLIINKQTGQWGTQYSEEQDLARVDLQMAALATPLEQFTISFEAAGAAGAKLKLEWETTSLSVEVKEKK